MTRLHRFRHTSLREYHPESATHVGMFVHGEEGNTKAMMRLNGVTHRLRLATYKQERESFFHEVLFNKPHGSVSTWAFPWAMFKYDYCLKGDFSVMFTKESMYRGMDDQRVFSWAAHEVEQRLLAVFSTTTPVRTTKATTP